MIKMTNREMLGILNCSIFKKEMLPARISFNFALLKKRMEEPVKIFNDERRKLAERYCIKDNAGNPVFLQDGSFKIDNAKTDLVTSEIEDLLDTEVRINMEKIKLDLSRIDELKLNLTADDLLLLLPVVNFSEKG